MIFPKTSSARANGHLPKQPAQRAGFISKSINSNSSAGNTKVAVETVDVAVQTDDGVLIMTEEVKKWGSSWFSNGYSKRAFM